MIQTFKSSIVFSLLFGCIVSTTFSQEGIQFFSGTWEEVLAAAKSEKKLIFVDAYTTWCGPCKMMDRNTYTDAGVGLYFNENFINYKFDMEKGEGLQFARTFEVFAYPTLIFINHEKTEIHREMGYKSPMEMMRAGQIANDPQKNGALLELEFEEGNQTPERIWEYAFLLKNSGKDYREAAKAYFDSIQEKDLIDVPAWEAIQAFTFEMDSREFLYLVKKKKRFYRKFGEEVVDQKIQDVLKKKVLAAALTGHTPFFERALGLADDAFKDKGQYADRLRMAYSAGIKNWDLYAEHAVHYFDTYSIREAGELERAAENLYMHVDELLYLQKAARWANQAQEIAPSFDLQYLQAGLLFRSSKLPDALRMAYQSLATAKVHGGDTEEHISMAEQLIADIEAAEQGKVN
ncbi:MAG: thioredoxin family protein [Bacteroidota bacterium]